MCDGFAAGLAARPIDLANLGQVMEGFVGGLPAFAAAAVPAATPRHFEPAEPGRNPTAGWDMFDTAAQSVVPADMPDPVEEQIEAARAEGYALGLAAGDAAARAQMTAEADARLALAASLAGLKPFDGEALARRLNQTVLHLVRQMVGEAPSDAERLSARIETASRLIGDTSQPAILRLHPDDVALVEGLVPEPLFAIADPHIARGGLLLESRDAVVEDGPEQWLSELAKRLDQVPLPC